MRKKISIDELSQKSSEQIIDDMSNARYSLLSSLGCGGIIARFFWVRYACLFFMNMAARKAKRKRYHSLKPNIALKTALAIIFARGAPSVIQPSFPRPNCGFVIGFNHPSLGEIIRLMGVCMSNYPTHKYLFPVNIIWYEALSPVIDRLAEFGFTITPMITPSAIKKLLKRARTPEAKEQVKRLTREFGAIYLEKTAEFIAEKNIVLVAPSAKRKQYLYDSKEQADGLKPIKPDTITKLSEYLFSKELEFALLPVAIIPPEGATRGLNLLGVYGIHPCNLISSTEMARREFDGREADGKTRRLERYFLEKIALELAKNYASEIITKPD